MTFYSCTLISTIERLRYFLHRCSAHATVNLISSPFNSNAKVHNVKLPPFYRVLFCLGGAFDRNREGTFPMHLIPRESSSPYVNRGPSSIILGISNSRNPRSTYELYRLRVHSSTSALYVLPIYLKPVERLDEFPFPLKVFHESPPCRARAFHWSGSRTRIFPTRLFGPAPFLRFLSEWRRDAPRCRRPIVQRASSSTFVSSCFYDSRPLFIRSFLVRSNRYLLSFSSIHFGNRRALLVSADCNLCLYAKTIFRLRSV